MTERPNNGQPERPEPDDLKPLGKSLDPPVERPHPDQTQEIGKSRRDDDR